MSLCSSGGCHYVVVIIVTSQMQSSSVICRCRYHHCGAGMLPLSLVQCGCSCYLVLLQLLQWKWSCHCCCILCDVVRMHLPSLQQGCNIAILLCRPGAIAIIVIFYVNVAVIVVVCMQHLLHTAMCIQLLFTMCALQLPFAMLHMHFFTIAFCMHFSLIFTCSWCSPACVCVGICLPPTVLVCLHPCNWAVRQKELIEQISSLSTGIEWFN